MGLFDIFSNQDAQDAANARSAGLQQGYDALSTQYGAGRDAVTSNYGAAAQPFQQLFTRAQPGAQAYGDATGANGADGYARAKTNFQTGPGFNFDLDTGLQAIDRGAAARGNVTSGNTLTAEQTFGNGLADKSWQSYIAGLQPYLGQQTSAAAGNAGVLTGEGNQLNSSYTNQGNAANNNFTGQGNAQAAADMNNYNVSQNSFNALMQGVKLAAAIPTGGLSLAAGGFPGGSPGSSA